MNPQTIQRLKELPEFKELVAFIGAEASKLQGYDGLQDLSFTERAYEVSIRMRMKERLDAILQPLLGGVDKPAGVDPQEFVV